MIHYKSQYAEINTHDPEKHVSRTNVPGKAQPASPRKVQPDVYFYVLLLSIGLGGLYYICNSKYATINRTEVQFASLDYPRPEAPPLATTKKQAPDYNKIPTGEPLQISGHNEVGEKITFTIDSFDKEATYKLYPGNGQVVTLNNKHTSYVYPASGTYNVRLHVSYKDYKNTVIYDENYTVFKAIEVIK